MIFDVPELIENVLNYVIDVRTCMVNRLWSNVVRNHSDYREMWGKLFDPVGANIVRYGSIKMIELYGDVHDIFIKAAKYGKIEFIKALINHPLITLDIKQSAYKAACINYRPNIISYLDEYKTSVDLDASCIKYYAADGGFIYLVLCVLTENNVDWPTDEVFKLMNYDCNIFKVISSIKFRYDDMYAEVILPMIEYVAKIDNLDLFKIMINMVDIEYMEETCVITNYIDIIVINGSVPLFQYLINHEYIEFNDHALSSDVINGNLNIVKFILKMKIEDNFIAGNVFPEMCNNHHLNVIKYLWTSSTITKEDEAHAMYNALRNCNVLIVKYLYECGVPIHYNKHKLPQIIYSNNMITNTNTYMLIKYLHSIKVNFINVYTKLCKILVLSNDVKSLSHMLDYIGMPFPINFNKLRRLAKTYASMNVRSYLSEKVNIYSPDTVKKNKYISYNKRFNKLIKHVSFGIMYLHKNYSKGTAFIYAVIYNNVEFIWKLFNEVDIYHKILAYVYSCTYGNIDMLKYLSIYLAKTTINKKTAYGYKKIKHTLKLLRRDTKLRISMNLSDHINLLIYPGYNLGNAIVSKHLVRIFHVHRQELCDELQRLPVPFGTSSPDYLWHLCENIKLADYDLLYDAVQYGHIEVVKYLWHKDIICIQLLKALLNCACVWGQNDILLYLYDNRKDVRLYDDNLMHIITSGVLGDAILHNNVNAVKLLLQYTTMSTTLRMNLMLTAIQNGAYDCIKYFHESGISIKLRNDCAMKVACSKNSYVLVKYLHKNGIPLTHEHLSLILQKISDADIKLVKYFVKHGFMNNRIKAVLGIN